MIPKVVHYCWFGGNQLPDDAKKCIESWRKFFPEYEIKEWKTTVLNQLAHVGQTIKWRLTTIYRL